MSSDPLTTKPASSPPPTIAAKQKPKARSKPEKPVHVYLPSPRKLCVLRLDPVASVSHLGSAAATERVRDVRAEHHLALIVKILEEPARDKSLHTCLVALLPEPPALSGTLVECAPVHYEVVRVRTGVVRRHRFLRCEKPLVSTLCAGAEAFLGKLAVGKGSRRDSSGCSGEGNEVGGEDDGEDRSNASTITPESYQNVEHVSFGDQDRDWQPVVSFSYRWPEEGLYDPESWLEARDRVASTILGCKAAQLPTDTMAEAEAELAARLSRLEIDRERPEGTPLANPILNECKVVQMVKEQRTRWYVRKGEAVDMYAHR